jgi:hypothetical protein
MKPTRFDVFEYIVDEIWNISTNPARSCGFAPYIQFMIETVAHEKFYKDVKHEPLRPAMPKDPNDSSHCLSSSCCGSLMLHPQRWCLLFLRTGLRVAEDVLGYLRHVSPL